MIQTAIRREYIISTGTTAATDVTAAARTSSIVPCAAAFFQLLNAYMQALFVLVYYIYLKGQWARDPIQLSTFRQLCKDFFVIWKYGLKISVPPKVHSINFHLGDEAEMMGNLSDSLEETMESLHVEDNRANKRLSAITNILKKEKKKLV